MSKFIGATVILGGLFGAVSPVAAACNPVDPPSCLYVSDLKFAVEELRTEVLDPSRNNYRIPLLIRYPVGAPGRRPVVIWNHGGDLAGNARERSAEWGRTLAAAGYVVIHPARTRPNTTGYVQECVDNGQITLADCILWLGHYLFGPLNTDFLIGRFRQLQKAHPALRRLLDPTRIVVGGHSRGSTVPLANAGAWRRWADGGTVYRGLSKRPIAFMASAPPGPEYAGFKSGFQSDSFRRIDGRPFLLISGVGDTVGKPSESRVAGWLRSMPGGKYLSSDTEKQAVHETMNIHKCDTVLRADHCKWIASLGTAFMDAVVRQRPEAISWLASDAYRHLTSGAIELHRR
jgi:hypothetical protein